MEREEKRSGAPLPETQTADATRPKGRRWAAIIIIACFLIGTIQAMTGSKGFVTTEINDQYLGVDGTYGDPVFLELVTLSDVQLVEAFDFGTCIEGEQTKNTVSGTYSCAQYGTYTVHAYVDELCIVVQNPDGVVVFNCGSDSHTKDMYQKLTEAVEKN